MNVADFVINEALSLFLQFQNFSVPASNAFFESFGQKILFRTPFERSNYYIILLQKLLEADRERYEKIHKGNPFYFIAIFSYLIRDFEKAAFFMDAALCEDQRNLSNNNIWKDTPAGLFMLLNESNPHQAALDITKELRREIETQVKNYNDWAQSINESQVQIQDLVDKFVHWSVHPNNNQESSNRSITTSLYSFILEYQDRKNMLRLRPTDPDPNTPKGTMEPHILHLFKGGIIFESILKAAYPNHGNDMLGNIYQDKSFQNDFGVNKNKINIRTSTNRFQDIIKEITNNPSNRTPKELILSVAAMIRNCTAHNLARDYFDENDNEKLFWAIMNAILLAIAVGIRKGKFSI